MPTWPMIMSDDAALSRQMRGSRTASGAGGAADSMRGPSRSHTAAATAASAITPASAYSAPSTPALDASGGRLNDAAAAPTGTAVCLSPSASPRSSRGNQPNTARPLAAIALAPSMPESVIDASSAT